MKPTDDELFLVAVHHHMEETGVDQAEEITMEMLQDAAKFGHKWKAEHDGNPT